MRVSTSGAVSGSANLRPSRVAIDELYAKLNECEIKAVALSLIPPRSVPVVSELFHTENLSLGYTELLQKCNELQSNYSDEQIKLVEENTQTQSKGAGFFKHRAGRIGASISGAYHNHHRASLRQSVALVFTR